MSTESQTLQFENARILQALYTGDPKLLQALERALLVQITTRDGWMRFDGPPEGVARAMEVFNELEAARRCGMPIRKHEFYYALRAVMEPESHVKLHELMESRIQTSPRRASIIPKSATQRRYLELIATHDLTFGIGPAGTGKTYLAMAMALMALKKEQVHRIILTRPAVEAGEELGFLPGDVREKITPYLRPLYDALHDMLELDERAKLIECGLIELAPLAFMRGRTLSRAFIILDEAQNATSEQMLMFLTRLGEDSKCVITGDPTQTDLPSGKHSGLIESIKALRGEEGIAFCEFEKRDVVRHALVQQIVRAYERHRMPTV